MINSLLQLYYELLRKNQDQSNAFKKYGSINIFYCAGGGGGGVQLFGLGG